jgi:hypothetical protein
MIGDGCNRRVGPRVFIIKNVEDKAIKWDWGRTLHKAM